MNIWCDDVIHLTTYTSNMEHCKCIMCEKLEDTKEAIRSHKLKKNRQHNVQKKKNKMTNNDLQNIT